MGSKISDIMKIAITHLRFRQVGGAERYGLDIARSLVRGGHEVQLIGLCDSSGYSTLDGLSLVGLRSNNPVRRLVGRIQGMGRIRQCLEKCGPFDLVIAVHLGVLVPTLEYARARNIPTCVVGHGIEIWGEQEPEIRTALHDVCRIVAVSRYTRQRILERNPGVDDKTVVIWPSVDTSWFNVGQDVRPSDLDNLLTVCRVTAASSYKGIDLVLEALPEAIARVGKPIEYRIVGDGDDVRRLKRLAKKCGVDEMTRFIGLVSPEQLRELYRQCTILVMPSYVSEREGGLWTGEGFGIVYVEAGACGKPAIACDVGGQTDAILHQQTGILIPPKVSRLSETIADCLRSPDRTAAMGSRARVFVEQNFSETFFQQRWLTLITDML
jgi:glycosyltransferase involved in cell wall biosynthesis